MDYPPPPWPGPDLRIPVALTRPWLPYLVLSVSLVLACTAGFSFTVIRLAMVADLQALITALWSY